MLPAMANILSENKIPLKTIVDIPTLKLLLPSTPTSQRT